MIVMKPGGEAITTKYDLEDVLCLKVDKDSFGMCVSICFTVNNGILYNLSGSKDSITAYECELERSTIEVTK